MYKNIPKIGVGDSMPCGRKRKKKKMNKHKLKKKRRLNRHKKKLR